MRREAVVDWFDLLCWRDWEKPRNRSRLLVSWRRFEPVLPLEQTSTKFVYRQTHLCAALLKMIIREHKEVRDSIATFDMCELWREELKTRCVCWDVAVLLFHSREFKNISVAATAILFSVFFCAVEHIRGLNCNVDISRVRKFAH
jgi:hypothetical protein